MNFAVIKFQVNVFLDFILPRICPSCQNKLLPNEEVICTICLNTIDEVSEEKVNDEYTKKFFTGGIISGVTSLYVFKKDSAVQHLIHSAKYNKRFQNAYYLGKALGRKAQSKLSEWEIDLIIPIPLHPLKKV